MILLRHTIILRSSWLFKNWSEFKSSNYVQNKSGALPWRAKKTEREIQLGCLLQHLRKIRDPQRYVQLTFIVFRLCKSVWGAVTVISVPLCFGFPFSFYISVLCIPRYLPRITSDLIIVAKSVWIYICYLIAGITAALAPAFISSPMTESLFTAKLVIISLLVWGMVNFVVRNRFTKI